MSAEYLTNFHLRLSVTTTLVVLITLALYAYAWWQRRPSGMWHYALVRIITLLLISNMGIGGWIAFQHGAVQPLHVVYAGVVLLPFLGTRILKRYAPVESHLKYMCVALFIVLVIMHRLAVTSSH